MNIHKLHKLLHKFKKLLLPLLFLFVIQLVIVSLVLVFGGNDTKFTEAVHGEFDLSEWDERENDLIPLDGEWSFYWQQHLSYTDFQKGTEQEPDLYAKLPNEWHNYTLNGVKLPREGYATYKLTIKLAERRHEMALKVLPPSSAYRLFINDQLLLTNGQAGESREEFVAYGKPQTVLFQPPDETFELIVQVSNFDYAKGGMRNRILLGAPDAMQSFNQSKYYKDFLLAGCLIMAIFYSISLYFMNREEEISLYFGLVCLVFLLRIPLTSSYYIYTLMPNATIQVLEWINYNTFHIGILFYALMIRGFFPDLLPRRACQILIVGTAIITLLLIIFPLGVYSRFYLLSDALGLGALAYTYYVILTATIKRYRYSWLVFFGNGLLLTLVVLDVMNTELNRNEMGYFSNNGIILFAFIYSFILARRFSMSFIESKRLSNRLLELDKLKDEFLANTSHELKTPLQGIVSISESLIEGVEGSLNEQQVNNLNLVVSSGKRLTQLINDILDISRLKHGDIQLIKSNVQVASLVEFVLQMNKQIHVHKPIIWKKVIPERLPPIYADENRIVQILFNLVGNAAKFTDKGEITVTVALQADNMKINVLDTGIGMSSEQLAFIFDPFTQVDSSIVRSYGGVGLGLSITKQLVELHGGTIKVESALHRGTSVTISLPIGQINEEEPTVSTHYENMLYQPKPIDVSSMHYSVVQSAEHILVVDDDHTNIQSAINILKLEGYTVSAVTSGREALEAIRSKPDIGLVILDVMMPELSGYEVCQIIRTTHSPLELPVLMVTAKNQEEDLVLGFEVGANDYLVKPYDRMEFRARVRTLIDLRKAMKMALQTELAFLQAQIKPHFIYNTLGAIMSLCYTDGRKAGKLIAVFSRYLRIVFENDHHHTTVELRRELELIEVYTDIEKERFGSKLELSIHVDPALLHCQIPLLTIQPIVENAICHGVMKKLEGGHVQLTITRNHYRINIVVEDNGVGMAEHTVMRLLSSEKRDKGVGISNMNMRVLNMSDMPIQIESKEGKGTIVSFSLPIIEKRDQMED